MFDVDAQRFQSEQLNRVMRAKPRFLMRRFEMTSAAPDWVLIVGIWISFNVAELTDGKIAISMD
jgi:hypothetical protein